MCFSWSYSSINWIINLDEWTRKQYLMHILFDNWCVMLFLLYKFIHTQITSSWMVMKAYGMNLLVMDIVLQRQNNHIKIGRASVLYITWAHTIKQNLAINDNWWQFNLSFYSKVWYFVNQKRTISNRFRFFKLINY